MFWKNKNECPITNGDKEWIETHLTWLNENIVRLESQTTILPTKNYFDHEFSGIEEDAKFVLQRVGQFCKIDVSDIELEFYSEEAIELDTGTVTQQEPGTGSAGLYIQESGKFSIGIEVQQLKKPNSLIATIAHELSHYVLIGQNEIVLEDEENEWLTDLLAISYGFGIFMGNTRFEFNQWQSGDGWGGWQYSIQGYLPQQITAHAMAEIEIRRTNTLPKWINLLKSDFQNDFTKSMNYLISTNENKVS